MATEGVTIEFLPDGVKRLAEMAFSVNEKTENIGARRLYTVMEKLLEDESFNATRYGGQTVRVDAAFVETRLGTLAGNEDLARYVL
jgi:ATP-dependent HslUV protease ATP-binding subunit HslU